MFALVSLLLIFVALLLTVWALRPSRATPEELRSFQIHTQIPSLFKTYQGIEIHYHQIGQGPDLVLIHGIGASTFIWRKLIPLLTLHFRITALDMPGFGRSQKPKDFDYDLDSMSEFIAGFLTSVNVSEFVLIGSSMGGLLSLWIAKKFPKRCHQVLTIAPSADPSLVRYSKRTLQWMLPLHWLINNLTMSVAVKNVIRDQSQVDAQLIAGYLLPFRDQGDAWRCFLKATKIIGDPRVPRELKELDLRSEFRHRNLWGDKDRVVPLWTQLELKKVLSRSDFDILPQLGHHPFEEDPAKIALLIREFLSNLK